MWTVYFWDVCLIFWTALDCRQLELWKATSPSRKDHCTFKCHSKVGDRKHRFPRNVENVPNYFSGRDIFYFSHRIKLMKGKWNQDLTLSFLFFFLCFSFSPLDFFPLCLPFFVQPTSSLATSQAIRFLLGSNQISFKKLKLSFLVLHFIGIKICMLLVLEWFWKA